MLLTVDIGNSNIVFEFMNDYVSLAEFRIEADREKSAELYADDIKIVLDDAKDNGLVIEAILVSSVVAVITEKIKKAFDILGCDNIYYAGENMIPDLVELIDHPGELGMDMVLGDIEAKHVAGYPCIVIDMGTATTINAINADGACIGCSILAGARTALKALLAGTDLAANLKMDAANRYIGKNTEEALLSGCIYGSATMLDGMIERMEEEMGCKAAVVATGGVMQFIIPHCRHQNIIYVPNLISRGLVTVYKNMISK